MAAQFTGINGPSRGGCYNGCVGDKLLAGAGFARIKTLLSVSATLRIRSKTRVMPSLVPTMLAKPYRRWSCFLRCNFPISDAGVPGPGHHETEFGGSTVW